MVNECIYFLAKVFGLYFFIMGLVLVIRRDKNVQLIHDFYNNPLLVFAVAWITLILGILAVCAHSHWSLHWNIIITILSYLMLTKAILHLAMPEKMAKINTKIEGKKHQFFYGAFCVFGVLIFILGVVEGL